MAYREAYQLRKAGFRGLQKDENCNTCGHRNGMFCRMEWSQNRESAMEYVAKYGSCFGFKADGRNFTRWQKEQDTNKMERVPEDRIKAV